MTLPLIAAGIAARAVAKKLATRAVGGIAGTGSKSINPVYKQMESKAKKQAAGFAAGTAATSAWIGSEMYKAEKRENRSK